MSEDVAIYSEANIKSMPLSLKSGRLAPWSFRRAVKGLERKRIVGMLAADECGVISGRYTDSCGGVEDFRTDAIAGVKYWQGCGVGAGEGTRRRNDIRRHSQEDLGIISSRKHAVLRIQLRWMWLT
jgi:hypothetical protein